MRDNGSDYSIQQTTPLRQASDSGDTLHEQRRHDCHAMAHTTFHNASHNSSHSSAHWSDYWQQQKAVNSFAQGQVATGYQGEVLAWWQQLWQHLPAQAVLVDLGCGNGGLALAALQYATPRNLAWQVHGVDAAAIAPLQHWTPKEPMFALLSRIQFHSECPMEQLPFASGSIDLCMSQFALEYSDMQLTLQQAKPLLRAQGKVAGILHHVDSPLSQDCRLGIAVLQQCLAGDLFRLVADWVAASASLSHHHATVGSDLVAQWRQQAAVQQIDSAIKAQVQQLQQCFSDDEAKAWFYEIMQRLVPLLREPWRYQTADIQRIEQSYRHYLLRLVDQQQAARNIQQLTALQQSLQADFDTSFAPLMVDGILFGWGFVAMVKA
jgi:SAM-dependent methyltransferase